MTDHENIVEPGEAPTGPEPCMPCRGTGKVVSHQGGHAQTVGCPWCHGSGIRIRDVDAQAHWREQEREQAASPPDLST